MDDLQSASPLNGHSRSLPNAMWLANANAALWAVGNGLVSTLLVIYLAADLGAKGFAVSLILAAPRFAGVLRLGVPAPHDPPAISQGHLHCAYVVSSVVLCGVPAVAATQHRMTADAAIALFVVAWCLYHFTEYVGTVTLWSWLGDLTPAPIRGCLLGRREFWLTAGRICGLIASVALASLWVWMLPKAPRWEPLALSAAIGALLMIVAVVPLAFMPGMPHAPERDSACSLAESGPRRSLTRPMPVCCFSSFGFQSPMALRRPRKKCTRSGCSIWRTRSARFCKE